eukprot:374170-Pyramimonas_sp.AAC.1
MPCTARHVLGHREVAGEGWRGRGRPTSGHHQEASVGNQSCEDQSRGRGGVHRPYGEQFKARGCLKQSPGETV